MELVIEAPASFDIHSSDFVRLSDGRLAANVPPEGVGFTVDTPDAEVVDYGTEFAVEVIGEHGCEVHVFNGEVKVQPKQPDSPQTPFTLSLIRQFVSITRRLSLTVSPLITKGF